ncbi:MAG: TolC family protein [Acidobacteria bacterium]|nr:TolC family protein [Acidobacteriota bacterium]
MTDHTPSLAPLRLIFLETLVVIFWATAGVSGATAQSVSTEANSVPRGGIVATQLEKPLASPARQRLEEEPIFLDELVKEALENNRDIQATQKKYEASRQRPSIASSLPDPMLSFASNNIGNPIPLTTVGEEDMSMAGLELMQELPFPGKLQLQGRMAQKEADADWHGYRGAQLEVVSQVKEAFYQLHFVDEATDVVLKDKDLLEKFVKIAEVRYAVGKGIQQDVLRAQVELTMMEKRLVELEQQRGSLVARINSLLNRQPESPLGRSNNYPKASLTLSVDELYQSAVANSPLLGQDQARIEKDNYALELARKEYYPDFAVGGGWASRGGLRNMWMARFEVKLPVYFWRKQRNAVRESANLLEESRRMYEATEQKLYLRVKDDYLIAKASDQLLTLYSTAIIPQATLALESSMASYQVGTLDFLSLLSNFLNVLEYELEYYQEYTNFHEALARLEATTGRRLLP